MTEQTRIGSLVEACINTAIGFLVTLVLTPIVYPLFGHAFTLVQNIGITAVFTVVSILRGYAVRRWFAGRIRAAALKVQKAAEAANA